MLITTKTLERNYSLMDIITQEAHNRQRIIKYFLKYGATKASERYHVSRMSIYRWNKRYDGTWQSLKEKSHRPKNSPNKHSDAEHKLIMRYYNRYKDDKILLWKKICDKGYKHTYQVMCQYIRRQKLETENKKAHRKNKPYQRAEYPGQKVQIDVKYVPSYCTVNGIKYYQYTAVDE